MTQNLRSRLVGSLSRFVAKAKRRLIFDGFDRRDEPKVFRRAVEDALNRQFRSIATIPALTRISVALGKAEGDEEILGILNDEWKTFSTFYEKPNAVAYMIWAGEQGGKNAAQLIGADGTFRLTNSSIKQQFDDRATLLIDSIDEANKESLRVAVQESIAQGLNVQEMQQYIFDKVEQVISPYKAEMISRTEFANAAGEVQKETYSRNGVERVQWVFVGDGCDICEPNDGEIRKIGDAFPSGDTAEPAHPNCKCSIIPIIPDDFDLTDAWLGN